MRSKKVEFNMPWPLFDVCREMCRSEGYNSIGRYFNGLALRNVLEAKRKGVTLTVANGDPEEQDALLNILLKFSHEEFVKMMLAYKPNEQKPVAKIARSI